MTDSRPPIHPTTARSPVARKPVDDPRLHATVLRTGVLAGLTEYAAELGVPCDHWFTGLRLDRTQVCDPDVRVSYRQASQILHRALATLPHADLGLRMGCRQGVGNFGVVGLAVITAANFGEGMRIGVEYSRAIGTLMALDLESSGHGEVAMRARMNEPDPAIEPFCCEELFASSLMLARTMAGPEFVPLRIELAYPAPAYAGQYSEVFGCPAHFGATGNRLVIDEAWLAKPLGSHNTLTARLALSLCREQMPASDAGDETIAAVERLVRARLRDNPGVAEIAAALHLTERTLRRHLLLAGSSFKAIHDRLRCERALELLREHRLTIAQVGASIGFRDAREFRRAFKRWTGEAPRNARG